MIDTKSAGIEVSRLAQMAGYPRRDEPAALRELALAAACAKDLETCKRVIGDFLASATSETRCPMPAEIRRQMYAAEQPEYWQPEWGAVKPSYACSVCEDTGMAGGSGQGDPWRWCACNAGAKVRRENPEAVNEQNAVLGKLFGIRMPNASEKRANEMRSAGEVTK